MTTQKHTPTRLSHRQRLALAALLKAAPGFIRESCTNSTMCALERRGLARCETQPRSAWDHWYITDAGRAALAKAGAS